MKNNVKAFVELSILGFIFILSVIGVGLYGIKESNRQNQVSKELYHDRMIPVGQLAGIRYDLLNMLLISAKVNQNKISYSDAEKTMSRNLDDIHTLWNKYLLTHYTDDEKLKSSKTTILLEKFSATVKKLKTSLEKNDREMFTDISENEFYPITTILLGNVNDLIFLQLKEGKNIFEKSFVDYDTSKKESIYIIVLILAFSIPVFYYFIRKNRIILNELNSSGEKLVEVEKNYRDFIDYAGDAILILDLETRILDLNDSACQLFGYTREDLFQMEILELIFPDETNLIADLELVEGNKSRLIYRRAKRKDGTFVDIEITNWLMEGDQSFAIIRDITERKRIDTLLKVSEEKYRYLFDNNPSHVIIWDIESLEVLEVNNAILDNYGYSKSEWEKMTILDFRCIEEHQQIKDYVEFMKDSIDTVFVTGGKYLNKQDKIMLMDVSSHKIIYNNRKAVLSHARDITEQVKAKKELKQSELKYHSLIEHAGDAILVIVENKNIIEANTSASQLLGYSREELLDISVLDLYPSDSPDYFATRWDLIKEGKTLLSETKLKRKDGSLVAVEISRRKLDDVSYLSIVRDITARKRIENELIESKEKLNLFIEHNPASLAMFDTDMNYIANSRQWLINYGVENMPLTGKNHFELFPESEHPWRAIFERCLGGVIEKKEEDPMLRRDGKLEWIHWEVQPWYKVSGEIGGIIMFCEVITERKKATEMFKYQFINSPDVIIYIDRDFKIESINRPSFNNIDAEQMIGQDCVVFLPKKSGVLVKDIVTKCFKTRELQEMEVEFDNNQWRYSRFVPIVSNDEVTHVMVFSTNISKRKQTEQKLLQSEEKYRALTENISDAILLLNEKFEIEYHSPAAERISGYTNEEVQSKMILDFIHPDERMESTAFLLNAFNSPNISMQKHFRIINKNGYVVWIEGTIVNLLDNKNIGSFVINYRDITNRKKLEEQQTLMASIVNSSDDAIISKNIQGIVTSWNIGAEKILGYSAAEMIGEPIKKLFPQSNIDEEEKILEEVKLGKSVEHFETKRMKKNGELIDVSLTISPVRDVLGNIIGASKIMRDITDNKKTEEELIRYNTDLKKANSELDRFVYSASHDLRAPLKSILGLLNITQEYVSPDNEGLTDCLSMLNSSVLKLDGFIEDILNYSRNTRTELDRDVIDFKELITKIQENYMYIDGVKDLDLQLEINSESVFVSDSKRMSIILNNLISNAFKYKDDTKKSYLKITFNCDDKSAKITIEDNGIGIADKHKEKVFNMFYRATMLASGSGLGLYIVKETIEKLKGTISIESEYGKGTKFIIEVPNQIHSLDESKIISGDYKKVS